MKKLILLIASIITFCTLSASTITYYVETTGSANNDGLSIENPFDSISTAIDSAIVAYTADNTIDSFIVEVGEGTFTEHSQIITNVKLTINGKGANKTILQGGDALTSAGKQLFTNSPNLTFYLNDVTLQNYGATYGTASSCGLIDLRKTAQKGYVNRCVFKNFTATYATVVAIGAWNTIAFEDCSFIDITSGHNTSAFFCAQGTAIFNNCVFYNCVKKVSSGQTTSGSKGIVFYGANGAYKVKPHFTNNTFIECGLVDDGGTLGASEGIIFVKEKMASFTNNVICNSKTADSDKFKDIIAFGKNWAGLNSVINSNVFNEVQAELESVGGFIRTGSFISDTLQATSPEINFMMDGGEIDLDTTATGLIYATAMGDSIVGQADAATQTTTDITGTTRATPGCIGAVEYIADQGVPTAIHQSKEASVKLYPNPVQDVLYISGDASDLSVYNTAGQLVRTLQVENGQVSLSSLSKGLYFVKIQNNNSDTLAIERLIKK